MKMRPIFPLLCVAVAMSVISCSRSTSGSGVWEGTIDNDGKITLLLHEGNDAVVSMTMQGREVHRVHTKWKIEGQSLHLGDNTVQIVSRATASLVLDWKQNGIVQMRRLGDAPAMTAVRRADAARLDEEQREAQVHSAVTNNLRMLSAAADQFYLESGKEETTFDQLVGSDKYVKVVTPVAGENYRSIVFKYGETLRVTLSNGKTVEFRY